MARDTQQVAEQMPRVTTIHHPSRIKRNLNSDRFGLISIFSFESNGCRPLTVPPYFCVILAPGTIDSKGGANIDCQARVLNAKGKPVPGLYACGNAANSICGDAYWTGGLSLQLRSSPRIFVWQVDVHWALQ